LTHLAFSAGAQKLISRRALSPRGTVANDTSKVCEVSVAVGKHVSDLEPGDVLGPLEYVTSPFVVREYCHAVELHHDFFQRAGDQYVPPMLVHLDKLRLYRHACPAGTGPHARIHIEFDADFHDVVKVGEKLRVRGEVTERYLKRGREYMIMVIELRAVEGNRLLVSYRDTAMLAYRQAEKV
jgi:hypothetical protein